MGTGAAIPPRYNADMASRTPTVSFRALLDNWQKKSPPVLTANEYAVRLPIDDAARLQALADLYPGRTPQELITDLLGVALRELEAAMPYVRGAQVISRDEQGDP